MFWFQDYTNNNNTESIEKHPNQHCDRNYRNMKQNLFELLHINAKGWMIYSYQFVDIFL